MGYIEIIRPNSTIQRIDDQGDRTMESEWCDGCRTYQIKAYGKAIDDMLWMCEACK